MNPMLNRILSGVIEGALRSALSSGKPLNPTSVARDAVKRATSDPVVANELNAEKPHQSRVVIGSTAAIAFTAVAAAVHLIEMWQSGTIDVEIALVEIGAIWGAGYALYGRLASGLKPLFSGGG